MGGTGVCSICGLPPADFIHLSYREIDKRWQAEQDAADMRLEYVDSGY